MSWTVIIDNTSCSWNKNFKMTVLMVCLRPYCAHSLLITMFTYCYCY